MAKRNKTLSKKNALRSETLLQNGLAYHQAGRLQEAETLYQSILQEQSQHPDALHLLGVIASQVGKYDLAVNLIENAIKINPTTPVFYNNLGNALKELGRQEDAFARYGQALAIKPDYAEAHNNMGITLQELGRVEETITHYEQALVLKPDYAEAYYNMGVALQELGRQEDAIACYEKALAINPDFTEAHSNMGKALHDLGRQDDAIASYEQALAIKPGNAEAYRYLSLIKPKQEQVSVIEKLLTTPTVSEKDAMHYHYALGNLDNDTKSFNSAFEHYLKANALKRKTISYDSQNHSAFVDSLIETYSENYFQEKTVYGANSEQPVFILGMPRSGTTLVEQVVSSHPQVYGAGELTLLRNIEIKIAEQFVTSSPYPECMTLCNDSITDKYSAEYLEGIASYSREAKRITDKLPSNFFRIGLIKTLFPKARIIHCKRNALDTCISIFNLYFPHGHSYSFDLTELGKYYLDYERLMSHWRNLFGSQIFEIQYEELVMNQEATSKQLIEYLDIEWNDECLNFHKNKRAVKTASNLQVREPIYSRSINRWKNYEKQLEPLKTMLNL
jgi:tetratricopeptide (TPR) repeat protein